MWSRRKGFWYYCKKRLAEPIFKKCLFNWDDIDKEEKEKKKLLSFLQDTLNICGPGWTGIPEIRKCGDKSIRIFRGENLPQIDVYEQEEKATLKISDDRTIDLKVKQKKGGKLNIYFIEFPHSQWWRLLVTSVFVIICLLLWKVNLMDLFITDKPLALWAILSLWILIIYLSLILWLPFHNIWECLERINYAAVKEAEFREKIRSSLIAFSIAFVVLSLSLLSIITAHKPSSQVELNIFKLVICLIIEGVILLIVTFEVYDSCLNPAFTSAQIARLYTKGWWFYTFGIYSIVIALLLYVYLLEPLITIMGVILFMVTFTYYLRTR